METKFTVIYPSGALQDGEANMPREPSLEQISNVVTPFLPYDSYFERVRVWYEGEYLDMFVDDMGALKRLPINEAATSIYHANMVQHIKEETGVEPNTSQWPRIHGVAILFYRPVWF